MDASLPRSGRRRGLVASHVVGPARIEPATFGLKFLHDRVAEFQSVAFGAVGQALRPTPTGVDMTIMSGVGHFVMMEDPDAFNQLLADTIKSFTAPRRTDRLIPSTNSATPDPER